VSDARIDPGTLNEETIMIDRRTMSVALLAGAVTSVVGVGKARAQTPSLAQVRNVVLVHGAYADGSSWSAVIGLLQRTGLRVTSVQNPLTSLADDVAATRRAIALQDGPTVLAAHSWGGTVISEAGDDPKVSALVYVAARAPDAGEDYTALAAKFPASPASAGLVKSPDGFAQLSEEAFLRDFAGGVERSKALVLYAVQGRIAQTLFAARTTVAAWRSKPNFYAVSTEDRTTNPELERFLAKRMNATTIELKTSHVSLVTHPKEIAALIVKAAGRTKNLGASSLQ
jgi:pimeloyl-ACP methyl ester carboxylesterase